jgi:hypothetical protein
MQQVWSECVRRLREAPDVALEWSRSGMAFLSSTIGSLPFLAATTVDAAAENPPRDESHYFLVPDPSAKEGFTLVERRRLPEGTGAVNSLPKVRIFHVHDPAALAVLEGQLAGKIAAARGPGSGGLERDLAGRLDAMGEEIDRQSNWVTGGLVVIGGVVVVANPLLGIGIAAMSLLPELGGKLAKFGMGAAAESLRRAGDSLRSGMARRDAAAEVKRMKPELVVDPVLKFLDRILALGPEVDPQLDELGALPEWWRDRDQRLTFAAAVEVWAGGPWPRWIGDVRARLEAVEGRPSPA